MNALGPNAYEQNIRRLMSYMIWNLHSEEQIKEKVVGDFSGYESTQCRCEERNNQVKVRRKEEEKKTKYNEKNQRQEEEKIIIPYSEEELDEEREELKREKNHLKECIRRLENQVAKKNRGNKKKIERLKKELLHHHNQKNKNGREEKEKKEEVGMAKWEADRQTDRLSDIVEHAINNVTLHEIFHYTLREEKKYPIFGHTSAFNPKMVERSALLKRGKKLANEDNSQTITSQLLTTELRL
ncbi:uncharacterized protein [Palaemon carinicauda]|uniref:uncharacterized protein n=1 Tax=Palaemon carinicauda TaxID=392227 RepID=UPI0035B5BFC2